jgi:predicted PurR-regulated permease PerM
MDTPDRRKMPEKRTMVITFGSWTRGVVTVALALALFAIRDLVLVLVASIVIASAVEPATLWMQERRIPRLFAVLGLYISMALVFAGLFYFLLLPLIGEFSNFVTALPDISTSLGSEGLFNSGSIFQNISESFSLSSVVTQINSALLSFTEGAFSSATFIFGGVLSFILIVILSFYMAVQEDGVGKFLRVVTPWRQERYIVDLWKRSQKKIGYWMQGQLILAGIIAVLVYLGLMLLRIPHALLLAVAAGVFEIIPLFGPVIAAIPAILVGFSTGGMSQALLIAGFFIIIQQFENQLIYPMVVKKVVGVPPMVSILALLIGGKLAGFLGILISVPLAAILMEFVSDLEKEKRGRLNEIESSTDNVG